MWVENDHFWFGKETSIILDFQLDAMEYKIGYPDFLANESRVNEYYSEVSIIELRNPFYRQLFTGNLTHHSDVTKALNRLSYPPHHNLFKILSMLTRRNHQSFAIQGSRCWECTGNRLILPVNYRE